VRFAPKERAVYPFLPIARNFRPAAGFAFSLSAFAAYIQ
jgi:hypothetical protein